jgi:hypothetical protein
VVEKLKSSMHAAFIHAEDGKWYRCVNSMVRECKIQDGQGDERDGEAALGMYEKME